MDIINSLTLVMEPFVVFTFNLFITRFVFLEPGIKGKEGKIYLIVTFLITALLNVFFEGAFIALVMLSLGVYIYRGHPRDTAKKVLAGLMVFPIFGLTMGLSSISTTLAALIVHGETAENAFNISFFSILIVVTLIAYLKYPDKIMNVIRDTEHRTLKSWERLLLCTIGILVFFNKGCESLLTKDLGDTYRELKGVLLFFGLSDFILTLTVVILVLVGNKQNYYHNKVSKMQTNIIITMAEIVENRDKSTGGHIKRTATYVDILATQLKRNGQYKDILTDEYISDMRIAAPLHDIGKIHVSDLVLNKDGPLDDEEYAVMKTHAPEGRLLLVQAKENLGEFSYLNVALDMAGAHHEWWDGSAKGYPNGLKGEEIPLCARIMAVADVFDALTAKRVYKPAMPLRKAYSIIESESGTHFDPIVVDAFIDCKDKIAEALAGFDVE